MDLQRKGLQAPFFHQSSPCTCCVQSVKHDGFNSEFIRSTGLQQPVLVSGDNSYSSYLNSVLSDNLSNLEPLASELMGLEKDVEVRAPGSMHAVLWRDMSRCAVRAGNSCPPGNRRGSGERHHAQPCHTWYCGMCAFLLVCVQVQTLDVPKQLPGPRWNVRQWCLYWKGREPHDPQAADAGPAGASTLQDTHAPHHAPQASNAAMDKAGSSGAGQDVDSEEDEADSAFVHQG